MPHGLRSSCRHLPQDKYLTYIPVYLVRDGDQASTAPRNENWSRLHSFVMWFLRPRQLLFAIWGLAS